MLPCLFLGAALALGQTQPARDAVAGGSFPDGWLPASAPGAAPADTAGPASPPAPLPPAPPEKAEEVILTADEKAAPTPGPGADGPYTGKEAVGPGASTAPAGAEQKVPAQPPRRAMPSPWASPPFPGSEYQGYPLIGVPPDTTMWPLMKALQGTWYGNALNSTGIRVYGWVTSEGNWSTSKFSNTPDSYWIRPNKFDMDQALLRFERNLDSVQTDHIDWGFRATFDYGIDYRYFTAGGWFSDQLLLHNLLYGFDPTELYGDLYIPWVAQGLIIRVGRWIACPDIETQFAPDNYMGSHSLLFTFDTYTQTGVMATAKLSDQWTAQAAVHAGTDMAPWYKGALWTGGFRPSLGGQVQQ